MVDEQGIPDLPSLAHIERGDQRDVPATDGPMIGKHDVEADERANVAYFRPSKKWSEMTQEEKGMDPYEPVVLLQAKSSPRLVEALEQREMQAWADEITAARPKKLEWITKASEARQEFVTGSVRDSREGKGRYDLLPPYAIQRLAQVYERGAAKYGDRNWEKGQPLTRFLDSALRHTFQVLEGRTDEDHAGHAIWNLMAFVTIQQRIANGDLPQELNDL